MAVLWPAGAWKIENVLNDFGDLSQAISRKNTDNVAAYDNMRGER